MQADDIWSLGCLFSVMLVRSSLEQEGVERYRQARIHANEQTIVGEYAPECFHNALKRLQCVDEFHREALRGCDKNDVLHAVSDFILGQMLQPRPGRKDALSIWRAWVNWTRATPCMGRVPTADTTTARTAVGGPAQPPLASLGLPAGTSSPLPPPPPGFGRQPLEPNPGPNPGPNIPRLFTPSETNREMVTVSDINNHVGHSPSGASLLRKYYSSLDPPLRFVGLRTHVRI